MKIRFLKCFLSLLAVAFAASCENPVSEENVVTPVVYPTSPEINPDTVAIVSSRSMGWNTFYPDWDTTSSALSIPNGIWVMSEETEEEIEIYIRPYTRPSGSSLLGSQDTLPSEETTVSLMGFYNNSMYYIFVQHDTLYRKLPIIQNFTVKGDVIFGEVSFPWPLTGDVTEGEGTAVTDSVFLRIASMTEDSVTIESYEVEYGTTAEGDEVMINATIVRTFGTKYEGDIDIANIPVVDNFMDMMQYMMQETMVTVFQ